MRLERIIVVDFSGTLIKPVVAEEANLKRYDLLGIKRPNETEHKRQHGTKEHYATMTRYIDIEFGIKDEMRIRTRQNYGGSLELMGKDIKTMIMTDLFRNFMYLVAQERGLGIYVNGMLDALIAIQEGGYKLAIVSGIREDIITGMFAITKCPVRFDFVCGQDPVLSRSNEEMNKELSGQGKIEFIIGDKMSDLAPAKQFGAKTVFVTWGHQTGGEEGFADFTVNEARELVEIIR